MNEKELNSMAYSMYLLMLQYGLDIEKAQNIKNKFDEFYYKLEKEYFADCDIILNELIELVGENNSEIIENQRKFPQ